MTLNNDQIASIDEMIFINIGNLLEHPMYTQMPDNMIFEFFRNLPSPFGFTINEWIGDAIMMTLISLEHQANGEPEEVEFSPERMIEITKMKRDQLFIDQTLEPLFPLTKADIRSRYRTIIEKYSPSANTN